MNQEADAIELKLQNLQNEITPLRNSISNPHVAAIALLKLTIMKSNRVFWQAILISILSFLQIGCKKDNHLVVTNSIYGTYARAGTGYYSSTGSVPGFFSGTTVRTAPINSTYIKVTIQGYLNDYVYDSVRINSDRSFSLDQRPNGYHIFGSGHFGEKTISLEIRNDSSVIVHKCDNVPKLYDSY